MNIQGSVAVNNLKFIHTMQSVKCTKEAMIRIFYCRWLTALKLNEIAADVRSSKLDM